MVTRKRIYISCKRRWSPIIWLCLDSRWFYKIQRNYTNCKYGMEEHILRYERFAAFLAKQGFVVCGNDHTGHGRSVEHWQDRGFFGEEEGSWQYIIEDMRYVMEFVKKKFPELPLFLIGHSMGSF